MKSAPLGSRSCPASVGVNASTDTAKDGIRNALPNNAAPATKLTMKAKQKSSVPNSVKSNRPWPLASICWPKKARIAAVPITDSHRIRGSSNQSHRLPWLKT